MKQTVFMMALNEALNEEMERELLNLHGKENKEIILNGVAHYLECRRVISQIQ